MTDILIEVPGKPIAKARPKIVTKSRTGKPFKYPIAVNKQTKIEKVWMSEMRSQIHGHIMFKGAVDMKMIFVMPIPKGWPKYRVKQVEEGKRIPHEKKPDIDNLIKFPMDLMNELVFKDDRQIVNLSACKYYGIEPKTVISVKEVN